MEITTEDIVIVASMDYTNWNSAERAGFEPAKPFWSLHTFQACAIDHSATSPCVFADAKVLNIVLYASIC